MKNADEKPNRRGNKRRKGNTEEDSNERNVQDDKGTDTNAVNNEVKSHGRGRKRMKQNNFPKQVEEESKTKDYNRKESIRSTQGTKHKAKNGSQKEGRILRNRTINPDLPNTSHVQDNDEELDADEFTCMICYKQFMNYNQIKAHKLLCTILRKKYVCSVCSKGFT